MLTFNRTHSTLTIFADGIHSTAENLTFIVWRLPLGLGLVWVARRRFFVKGVFLSLAHPHARCGVLYSDTLSARDVGGGGVAVIPRPTSLLTARVLVNGGSALPRVSTCPSPRRISYHTGSSQQSPALWLRLAPSATPWCFPMSDARRVYLVDSFIARDPQYNAHTTSLVLTLSGHTFSG